MKSQTEDELKSSVADIVGKLFENGNTPCKVYGIDAELIERVEIANPHVAKQYPDPIK